MLERAVQNNYRFGKAKARNELRYGSAHAAANKDERVIVARIERIANDDARFVPKHCRLERGERRHGVRVGVIRQHLRLDELFEE